MLVYQAILSGGEVIVMSKEANPPASDVISPTFTPILYSANSTWYETEREALGQLMSTQRLVAADADRVANLIDDRLASMDAASEDDERRAKGRAGA